ncbi:MAG: two-component sensor histidine kinase [Phycisphaerales bacterium]|nr:two-component sensor histidine kinase [Phycisphaerales bacterium]
MRYLPAAMWPWSDTFWGLLAGAVVGLAVAIPLLFFAVKRQTSRARAAEAKARTAERLAEIGAMTGGLAHEIKNPLSTITLNAQLLAEAVKETPGAEDDPDRQRLLRRADILRREVDRLSDILRDFLRFAGNLRLEPAPHDVNALVEQLADFYTPQAEHHGIRLRADLAPGPLMARVDPNHFKQALLNLLINATQAMEGHEAGRAKELILQTRRVRGRRLGASGDGPAERGVVLHVIDTGPGIGQQALARIFEPYFTTKSGGTGLGLPTTKRIVEQHGGTLTVHSEPGKGSDFVIWLPEPGDSSGTPAAGGSTAG